MKILLKNTTDEIIHLSDISLYIQPLTDTPINTDITPLDKSRELIELITYGHIVVNDYQRDLLSTEAIKFITTNQILPTNPDGKLVVTESSKRPGLYTYWTGRGDDCNIPLAIGFGTPMIIRHIQGDPISQHGYYDFWNIDNETQMHEGYIIWDGAKFGDTATCEIVVSTVEVEAGTNTNFNLVNNYLIVPAAGDGTINVTSDLTNTHPASGCLVESKINELGEFPLSFWNADYNPTTMLFENITAAPYGDGGFNLFAAEIVVTRYVNHINLLGNGFERMQSADSSDMGHGLRVKIHANTLDDDHDWSFSTILTLQRKKTY